MDTQNEFEANDFILCTKCNYLLLVPINGKKIICAKCENVIDFINISDNHKYLSYKCAFKYLAKKIYKDKAEKGYVYNREIVTQQAQETAQPVVLPESAKQNQKGQLTTEEAANILLHVRTLRLNKCL